MITSDTIIDPHLTTKRAIQPGRPGTLNRRVLRIGYNLLIIGAVILRVIGVGRPIDGTTNVSWRECDEGSMARNFWRGDMNILYPQIDWRGDGPGYVEGEFPLLPWMMAVGYKIFGYQEQIGRIISLTASLLSLLVFYRLARKLMPAFQAKCALLFLAYNPVVVNFSANIQPDGLMLLAVILSLGSLISWTNHRRTQDLLLCGISGALAILLKLPAIYIGLVCAFLILEKQGLRAFRDTKVWFLMLVMIIPPTLWYSHAHQFWLVYGNSLGLSNETHWIGWDFVKSPILLGKYLFRLLKIEFRWVYGITGIVLAWMGLGWSIKERRVVFYWAMAALCFYVVALRTTADDWSIYYHYLSIPPACLLMGSVCSPAKLFCWPARRFPDRLGLKSWAFRLLPGLTLGLLILQSVRAIETSVLHGDPLTEEEHRAAIRFGPEIEEDGLVVTIGGPCKDETGAPVAWDNPGLLFWMDRKGFSICNERVSLTSLSEAQTRGARYFAGKAKGSFAEDLKKSFTLIDQSDSYVLFALK